MTENYKSSFVPAQGIYLLNHSVGRPPISTRRAWAEGFLEAWESAGEDVWPQWLESIDGFRNAIAQLLGGSSVDICPQTNLSSALTKILSGLSLPETRRTILYTEQDFPSIGFVLQQAVKNGYKIRAIPNGCNTLDPQIWEDYLCEDVGLVMVTHVHSNTSLQAPVAEICSLARSRGIVSVVDAAQSVGVVPINVKTWRADFVIGSCVKWLCGGPGAGFLWVDPELQTKCEPTDIGWFSHENPFEFDIHNFRYAKSALRFWGGTPSVQPYVTAANSIRLMHNIGIDNIRAHNVTLTNSIIEAVDEKVLVTPKAAEQRGGTVVLRYPENQQQSVCDRLKQAGVGFDIRPTGIRLSPHIYNDREDIGTVINALQFHTGSS
jgi:kynureninase